MLNKVMIIGNLTRDPEIAETPTGVTVCKFAVAVNRNYKDDNGEVVTDFFNVVAWRKLAETCRRYLAKGKKVAIVGTLQNRSYTDRDGVKRYVTEIIAEEAEFLTPRSEDQPKAEPKARLTEADEDDGLPF